MGELTVWVCSLGSVVLMLMVLAVAIVTTMERTDSGDVARMREAILPSGRLGAGAPTAESPGKTARAQM